MPALQTPHLTLRGHTFYFRRAIPRNLRARLGRCELKASLKTSDRSVARIRCRELTNHFERLFLQIQSMPELTHEMINKLVRSYFKRVMQVWNLTTVHGPKDPDFDSMDQASLSEDFVIKLRQQAAAHTYDQNTQREAEELLKEAGHEGATKDSDEFDAVCHGILRAKIEQHSIYAALLKGEFKDTEPVDPLFKNIGHSWGTAITGGPEANMGPSLKDLSETYCKFKQQSGTWVQKTFNENRRVLDWFIEQANGEKPIGKISIEDVRNFRDSLLSLPASFSKAKQYKELTFMEAAKAGVEDDRLSLKTARKYLYNLKSFLHWCEEDGYISKSPAGTIKINFKNNAQEDRPPFSDMQLTKIFTSPQYTGHKSAIRRSIPGDVLIKDGKFWIPLIGLYSGMRLGEIVQLLIADIREVKGTLCFYVTRSEDDDKQLKTSSSQRIVPVHPILVKIGFLEYLNKRRDEDPTGRVFPDIKPGKDGYHSHNFSKFYSRYLTQIGAKTSKTSFHSFRHNFTDALRNSGAENSRVKALLGHKDSNMTATYGSKFPADVLYEDVMKVSYQVALDHLINASKA